MATWASLTPTQQAIVTDYLQATRDFAGQLARCAALGEAIGLDWSASVSAIVGSLDANTVIPVTNNVQGAENLKKEDVTNLAGYAINLSDPTNGAGTSYATPFQVALYIRAAGLYNTLQQGRT